MAPTFENGESIYINRWSTVERGDVVIAEFELDDGSNQYVKRVIGMGGETLASEDCVLTVDGRVLTEPYVTDRSHGCGGDFTALVPDGHFFLLGDNRAGSQDSRSLGSFPSGDIVGEVVFAH